MMLVLNFVVWNTGRVFQFLIVGNGFIFVKDQANGQITTPWLLVFIVIVIIGSLVCSKINRLVRDKHNIHL